MIVKIDQVYNSLSNWIDSLNPQKLDSLWPLKGGWEGWAQVDYAAFTYKADSTIDLLREQPIFINDRQKVDWLFNDESASVTKEKIAIELKCESLPQWERSKNYFIGALQDDEQKLNVVNLKAGYKDCIRVVVGIFFSPQANEAVKAAGYLTTYKNGLGFAFKNLSVATLAQGTVQAFDEELDIEIGTLSKGCIGFKGAGYKVWDSTKYIDEANNNGEWSGLYVAQTEATAEGYLPDMVQPPGNGTVYIHNVNLTNDLKLITCLDDSFKTGNIDMTALKTALRQQGIDVAEDELLMPKLGKLGYAFKCYNNEEGAIEIIIPNMLAGNIEMTQYKECVMKGYILQKCELAT